MKVSLLTILALLFLLTTNTAAIAQDKKTETEKASDSTKTENTKTDPQKTETKECEKCIPQSTPFVLNLISFCPLLLFFFIFSFVFTRLKKEGYKISDALKENDTIPVSVPNPLALNAQAGENVAPFVEENTQPKSASRLIAFITGLVTLGIASSFSTFWLFTYLKCGSAPDLTSLTNVVLSLGLGIVPYAFNKISKAIE